MRDYEFFEFFINSDTVNQENEPWKKLDSVVRSWAALSGYENDQNNYMKRYVSQVEDSGDGSGDVVITFPPDLMEELGWYEGLVLKFKELDGNSFSIEPANPADVVKKQHKK